MLWPIILPFQITCVVLSIAVIACTLLLTPRSWNRGTMFFLFSVVAMIAFVPSCTGIMMLIDGVRFGDFHYAAYADIPDIRSQRYLPPAATNIQMRKHANGYLARYQLPASELTAYLDNMWKEHGSQSAVERGVFFGEGQPVDPETFAMQFGELGWECPPQTIMYSSPSEADGGGAFYYVDAANGMVYQRTGFW